LAGSSAADRFRAWTGRSGRRYVFSVYRIEAGLDRIPTEAAAVVIAVERVGGGARRLLWADHTGGCAKTFMRGERVTALLRQAGFEIHLHLLAADEAERRSIVSDLRECVGP
jgi:hypothetical protein